MALTNMYNCDVDIVEEKRLKVTSCECFQWHNIHNKFYGS
jgi:hypothetical protein